MHPEKQILRFYTLHVLQAWCQLSLCPGDTLGLRAWSACFLSKWGISVMACNFITSSLPGLPPYWTVNSLWARPFWIGVLEPSTALEHAQQMTYYSFCSPLSHIYTVTACPQIPHQTSFFLKKLIKIYLFIWLCWVFVVASGIFSCGMWDLSSSTRDRTWAPCIENRVLITGLLGSFPCSLLLISSSSHRWIELTVAIFLVQHVIQI